MKIIRCLTHQPIADRDKWNYVWKEYTGTASYIFSPYDYIINDHRVPSLLSLHAHLTSEHHLETLWNLFFLQFPFDTIMLPYDILHGLICAYNMREILQFWKERVIINQQE